MKKSNTGKKPYNRCLICEYLGNGCDGPRTSSMSLERWSEWLQDVKKIREYTNAEIAEMADVSITTVTRVMSGNLEKDIMRSTAAAIENATIGSTGQYPCYLAFLETIPDESKTIQQTQAEMAELRKNIEHLHISYQAEMATIREEAQRKIDYLKEENERLHKIIDRLMSK